MPKKGKFFPLAAFYPENPENPAHPDSDISLLAAFSPKIALSPYSIL